MTTLASNHKIVERGKIVTPNTYTSLSLLGTGTLIKSGVASPVSWTQTSKFVFKRKKH
jgi:hypothetical protein